MDKKPVFKKSKIFRRAFRWLRWAGYSIIDVVACFLFDILEKKNEFDKKSVRKILLIRLDRIGDLVLTTPALKVLRNAYPEALIDILVSSYTKDLLFDNENVNRVLTESDFGSRSALEAALRKEKYDAVLVFHPGYANNKLAYLTGAKWRIGYIGLGGSFFLNVRLKDDRDLRLRHETVSALEVVGKLQALPEKNIVPLPEIKVSPEGLKMAREFLNANKIDRPFAVLHPGSRQPYIRWEKEGFAKVGQHLIEEKKMRVVFTSGKAEYDETLEAAYLIGKDAVIAEGLSLKGLIGLLSLARIFVGNSTGPMHIAAALNVPTVAVFGNAHPLDSYKAWGPINTCSRVIHSEVSCKGCHPGDCLSFDCMKSISPDSVIKAVDELLRGGCSNG